MLINNLQEFGKYIIVDSSFDKDKLLAFSKKAEREVKNIIGKEQYDELVVVEDSNEIKDLLCSSIACLGLLYAMPALKLRITNAGMYTTATTNARVPEWWEVRDLHNSLRDSAFSSIDEALKTMEEASELYPAFINSQNYTVIKEVLVTNASTFNLYYNINNSRLTYLGLLPYLRECIDQYLLPWLGDCLFSLSENEKSKNLLEYIQKALVAFTVAKAAESGSFSFVNNTLVVKWEQMPWEKSEKVTSQQLNSLRLSRESAGNNYLNLAKNYIKNNLSDFPCIADKQKIAVSEIYKKRSGLYLG